ncbi:MAG: hypothetical protein GX951_04965 [Mollicutes bacterium]|nr:hypothetical protein [Mollicutes bacterium]
MRNEEKVSFIKEVIDRTKLSKSIENWYDERKEYIKISLARSGVCIIDSNFEYACFDDLFKSIQGLEKIIKTEYKGEKENILKYIKQLENEGYLRDKIFYDDYAVLLDLELRRDLLHSKILELCYPIKNSPYKLQVLKIKKPINKAEFREVLVNFYAEYNPEKFEVRYRKIQSEKDRITQSDFYSDYIYVIQEIDGEEYKSLFDQFLLDESTEWYDPSLNLFETREDYIDEIFFERMYVEEFEGGSIDPNYKPYATKEEEEEEREEVFRLMREGRILDEEI